MDKNGIVVEAIDGVFATTCRQIHTSTTVELDGRAILGIQIIITLQNYLECASISVMECKITAATGAADGDVGQRQGVGGRVVRDRAALNVAAGDVVVVAGRHFHAAHVDFIIGRYGRHGGQ